jgi:hypothetical protein
MQAQAAIAIGLRNPIAISCMKSRTSKIGNLLGISEASAMSVTDRAKRACAVTDMAKK